MFATLRYGEHDGDLRAVEQSTTFPVQGQGGQHYACFECRHRKLKCTEEKAGCNRCVTSGSECVYPRAKPSKRGGQRTKRSADDVGKSPELRLSEAEMQPAQNLPRPTASKSRRDDQPTQRVTPEHQSLSVAPVAPMLPDDGNDDILFAAPGDLGFAQLQDFYGMENMPDTQMKEVLEVSGFDRLSRDVDSMEGAGGASGSFATGSGGFDGGLNFDGMFDFGNAAMSSGSPVAAKASDVRPARKRTTSGLAASRAATQPIILTPEPSRSSSSQRAVTPEYGECASLAIQRTNKPRSAVQQHSSFEIAPSHTESRCIKQAMSLSYKARFCSKHAVRMSTAALFRLLSEFRQCVHALNALAACTHCTSSAPFMTFLADVCERLGKGLISMTTLSAQVNIDGGDWTEVNVVDRITQIVARVSSRMFGGKELSENDEWVQASIQFALDGFVGARAIKKVPTILRPIAQYFIPALRNISAHHQAARRAAKPLLTRREKTGEEALDLLYWMAQEAKGDEADKDFIASILLKVSFAAIHTSAAAPSQLLYDLCAMPEYIEPLRREVESVLNIDGTVDKRGFHELVNLDSIMKESQRLDPLLLVTFERAVHQDYRLSDGFVIPAHTTIGIPTVALNMDPNLYPEPEKYDDFRFEKIRQTQPADAAARAQYAASNLASMAFGFGRHACPGRWFAGNEIKAIMAYILMEYDFKFPEGVKERPASIQVETQYLPNHAATLMFRKRKQT